MPRIMVATCLTATNGKRGYLSSCSWGGKPNPHWLDTSPWVRPEADAPRTCWKVLLRNRAEQLAGALGLVLWWGHRKVELWSSDIPHYGIWHLGTLYVQNGRHIMMTNCLKSLPTQPHEHRLSKSIPGGHYTHPSESPTSRPPCRADEKIISTSQSQIGFAPQKDIPPT